VALCQVEPFEGPPVGPARSVIDQAVFSRLAQMGIRPSRRCSDAVFVRRVYLDLIGTLPEAEQARSFLQDRDPNKRAALIDALLCDQRFADYWAMRWADVLRVKAEFPINLWPNAAQAYHRWIRMAISEGYTYDRFVRELLTSNGSNFRVPQVNFYRAVQDKGPVGMAQAVALTFMGVRAQTWPDQTWQQMALFFSQIGFKATGEWKEQIVFHDKTKRLDPGLSPILPDGRQVSIPDGVDPRSVFADWLIDPRNPWFARSVVNRIWYWLMGRGIIHEPDDIRLDNPPSNPELLAYLEKELIQSGFDLRHIYRLIANSQVYQLSCISPSDDPNAGPNFAYYQPRRLDAEVLIDAICQVTGTFETYSSMIPEPFTFVPADQRAICLPDGSITSSFLDQFGRPPRDTGLVGERNNQISAKQRLHMLNSSHIQRKIEQGPRLRAILGSSRQPQQAINRIYLTILSRFPTQKEVQTIQAYLQAGQIRWPMAMHDLAWALVNTSEFLYRH